MYVGGSTLIADYAAGEMQRRPRPAAASRAGLLPLFSCLAAAVAVGWWATADDLGASSTPQRQVQPVTGPPAAPALAPSNTEVRSGLLKPGERLTDFLLRQDVGGLDAAVADRLATAEQELPVRTQVTVEVLSATGNAPRDIHRVVVRPDLGTTITISRRNEVLTVRREVVQVDRRPLRLRGTVGSDLRTSLRQAGASWAEANAYLSALRERIPLVELKPTDRFDLMSAVRSTSAGDVENGPLLYVGLERTGGGYLQLLRTGRPGEASWVDASGDVSAHLDAAMIQPVRARISSGFGVRVHPILRFLRLHRGVDFAAPAGTPVAAAAGGVVVRAGWAGGYGNQVRVNHSDGSQTSYSHLSAVSVRPGQRVTLGQQLGRVGSTGLSTGPHLHFELHRDGAAVDPLLTRIAARPAHSKIDADTARSRMRALLSTSYRERRLGA